VKKSLQAVLPLALALVTSVVSVREARAATDVCISEPAKAALAACPNNGPGTFATHGKAPALNFHSAPAPADLKKRDQQTKPNQPSEQMTAGARDDRKSRLQQRAKGLLVGEIAGLEQLYQTTPANSPDRLQLVRRLAEDYVELENAGFTEKTQAEIKRDELKKTNPTGASQQQAVANQANTIMQRARSKAISYYTSITTDFPNYPQLDEVLYYLAYEYEQGNNNDMARKTYFQLIQSRPNSKYIPNAYLAFGELFFNEAQGDPSKWPVAAQAYQKVIGFPPPENKVYGYAWYKLAYVQWNSGDFPGALSAFKKTIDYGTTFTQVPGASKLADSARRDIIPVYALSGNPSAAYNFFHNLSGDPPGQSAKTFNMMDELGNNYLDTGHYPEAIALYRDLLIRDRAGDKTCIYQAHITEATMAMKSGNKDGIIVELDKQLAIEREYKTGNHPEQSKQECANKTAALLTETAMAWHLEAVGSGGQRGTGDQRTMDKAAAIYKKVVATWPQSEFQAFVFPRIVKEDWPNIYKIKYAMADLLYFQGNWAACGPAFDAVVAENPQAPEAAEAAYASVLCYQNIYDQAHKGGSDRKGSGNLPGTKKAKENEKQSEDAKLAPKEFSENQKGMITAFNRYICYIHPPATDTAGQDQLVEVEYARARTYFESQHWEEAAAAFRDIAINHADKDVGIYAAQLYLESVNVIGTHYKPTRISCFNDMATDVPKFLDLYCTGDKLTKNADQCTSLTKIQCDIQRLKAQKITEKADAGAADALALYEETARTYLDMWHKYGETPLRANQPVQCDRMDEIVYNAAKAYQAARLIGRAISTRMILLNPDNRMEKSPLAVKATYEIGGNFQAVAVYDQAANWYEKFAEIKPTPEKADVALSDAVQLRLGLGQAEEAIHDAAVFRAKFGATKPTETAAIQFAIGAHYASVEAWPEAKLALQGAMSLIDRSALDIQLEAHATLARTFTHVPNGAAGAGAEYAKVRALWPATTEAVLAKLKAAYPTEDDGQRGKRLAKALTAVGEAFFYAAEEHRHAEVDSIRFPEYHGSGKKDDVLKHVQGKVADWMKKKAAAIVKVEAEYKKIVDLQPEPPPRWVIAAGSRVGLLWGGFVDDFRRAPYPKDWDKKGCAVACGTADELSWQEIKANYLNSLDTASQPFKDGTTFNGNRVGAKPALVTCLNYSLKFQYFDQFSRDCEVWLAKNYKAEYHVVDELRGAPTQSNNGADDPVPPLTANGQLYEVGVPASAPAPAAAAGTN
jgi:tetratricopeptide (TPR) repeat protein